MGKLNLFHNIKSDHCVLTPESAAYIAGFVDGEGTITLVRSNRPRNTSGFQFTPYFSIPNTNLDVLLSIRKELRNGRIELCDTGNVNYRMLYSLRFTPRQIRQILPHLLPYLRVKQRQCELVMEFLDTTNNNTGVRHTPEFVAKCSKLEKSIRMLNPRGDNMRFHSQLARDWRDVCETPLIGLQSVDLAADSGDLITH